MNKNTKIYISGHRGMVGSAIRRKLEAEGYSNLVFRTSSQLDLRDQYAVKSFFESEKPEYVFMAAAKVGGIMANSSYKAYFLYDNLMIQTNVIHESYKSGAKKLLFLGSSCIYPKHCPQPMKEEYLLTGPLEETNDTYAIAKISGIKMCQAYREQYGCNFISVMPTNLYGPNDNYDLENSHVLPALIRKFHEAKVENKPSVTIWGTGSPLREFLHADDLADACLFLMNNYDEADHINVGVSKEISIKNLALLIKDKVGFEGKLEFDTSKPDGTPRKMMDSSKIYSLGWKPSITLDEGLTRTISDYKTVNAI